MRIWNNCWLDRAYGIKHRKFKKEIYLKRNIEAQSFNQFCRWKAVSIVYFLYVCVCVFVCVCVSVVLGIQHHNVHAQYFYLWLALFYNIFQHYLTNSVI
jgi:hypothetical protein